MNGDRQRKIWILNSNEVRSTKYVNIAWRIGLCLSYNIRSVFRLRFNVYITICSKTFYKIKSLYLLIYLTFIIYKLHGSTIPSLFTIERECWDINSMVVRCDQVHNMLDLLAAPPPISELSP